MNRRHRFPLGLLAFGALVAACGLALLIVRTIPDAPTTPTPALAVRAAALATPATPAAMPDPNVAALRTRLDASVDQAGFIPTVPGTLAGLKPGAFAVEGPAGGPAISYYLFDPVDKTMSIRIMQSAKGFGTVAPLRNATSTVQATILGAPVSVQVALPTDGAPLRHLFTFEHGGVTYLVTTNAIPLARVVQVLDTSLPIR